MSLVVWLPLNGSLENQGLSDAKAINHNATVNNNGKIGKCYQNTASNYITIPVTINVKQSFSLCYWYRIDTWNSWGTTITLNAANGDFLGMCPHSNGTMIGTNWYETRNGTNTPIFDSYHNNTIVAGQWNHIVITFNGTNNIKTYINGILVSNETVRTNPLTNFTELTLFRRGRQSVYGYSSLNDVRVYDHALSAKEVGELAKGLVLHYRLAGPGQENLIKNSYDNVNSIYDYTGKASLSRTASNGTATKICAINFPTDSATYSNYNSYIYFSRDASAVQKDGKTYTLSFKVKASKPLSNYDFRYEYTNSTVKVNITTDWSIVKMTGVANGEYGALYVCFGKDNRLKINGGILYIADLKLEEGSVATPWCPNPADALYNTMGYNNNIEYDCSGYLRNGTKSGNITWDIDSPRYVTSYKFNTGSDYIKSNFTATMNELSISFWVKPSSSNGRYSIICSNYNNPSGGLWIATNCEGCSVWAYQGAYMKVSGSLANDTWHHCVYTFKDGVSKWYINGEEKTLTTNTYTGTTLPITDLTIGNSYTGTSWNTKRYGNLSDFRLYTTALSAPDIAELYHSAVIVDNTGKNYAYEYFEA